MRKLLLLALFLTSATIFAQGTLTGTVIDSSMDGPLPGANVMVKGANTGTTTNFDGEFSLKVNQASGTLEISFVGYEPYTLDYSIPEIGQTVDLGRISLNPDAAALDEIIITSYSLAIDRKTPVAVSTIKAEEIETRLGNQEFPELLNSTPGVYATKSGGGYGDAELRLRGFNSENIAVMINGVPVNDMENGRVYWSNWAGLADVTRSMQVQRGLGAARVAVPSIGGTVNILTKTTDMAKGGNIFAGTGNDGYQKYGFTLSTGLLDNGFAATISASKTSGDGYIDGTPFEGYSYFVNLSKDFGDDHKISFTAFGAPQEHGQRWNRLPIKTYRESDRGEKYNTNWGYKNGEFYTFSENFYHKPQISLNHYWRISDRTDISTAAYFSTGTGGGMRVLGEDKTQGPDYRFGVMQPINFDAIVAENIESGALGSETIRGASRNDHTWYGILSTLSTDITDELELMAGLDLRSYEGRHFQEVDDLLGGSYFYDDSDVNNPVNAAQVGSKINYNNDGLVNWIGGFAQAEYSNNELSAFANLAVSNTAYKRIDYFRYLDSDPNQETDWANFLGYSAKGGANYNINDHHNVFANAGYFEKAPFMNAVFLQNDNILNENAENQKITSAELGYGFRSQALSGSINAYWTNWKDRTLTRSFEGQGGELRTANILGIDALHQGIELDFRYRPIAIEALEVRGMVSVGDWIWQDDVTGVEIFNEEGQLEEIVDIFIKDLKVGNSAQTSMALGADYEVLEDLRLRANWTYFSDLYADFDPNDRLVTRNPDGGIDESGRMGQAWEVPAYSLVDFGLTYGFDFGGFDAVLNGNINNILDTTYVADARDSDGTAAGADVWYGFGRTFSFGLKLNF